MKDFFDKYRATARHVVFWSKWAFYVLVVMPSVMLCAALAFYSDFSFSAIPNELLQYTSERAAYPAARDGYLTVRACQDPVASATAGTLPVLCKTFGFEQRAISSMAAEAGQLLRQTYFFLVLVGAAMAYALGLFARSRRAFRQSFVGAIG